MNQGPDPSADRQLSQVAGPHTKLSELLLYLPKRDEQVHVRALIEQARGLLVRVADCEHQKSAYAITRDELIARQNNYITAVQRYSEREKQAREKLTEMVEVSERTLVSAQRDLEAIAKEFDQELPSADEEELGPVDEATLHGRLARVKACARRLSELCRSIEAAFVRTSETHFGLFTFSSLRGTGLEEIALDFLRCKSDVARVGLYLEGTQREVLKLETFGGQAKRDMLRLRLVVDHLAENNAQMLVMDLERAEAERALDRSFAQLGECVRAQFDALLSRIQRGLEAELLKDDEFRKCEQARDRLGEQLARLPTVASEVGLLEYEVVYRSLESECKHLALPEACAQTLVKIQKYADVVMPATGNITNRDAHGDPTVAPAIQNLQIRRIGVGGDDFRSVLFVENSTFARDFTDGQLREYVMQPGYQLWGAFIGSTMVGYALWSWGESTSSHVESLYVWPEFRRKGVGKGVLEEVEKFVAPGSMHALSPETNAEALGFFTACGFRARLRPRAFGHDLDGYQWTKEVEPARPITI